MLGDGTFAVGLLCTLCVGQRTIRPYWKHYFEGTDVLVGHWTWSIVTGDNTLFVFLPTDLCY